MRRLFVLFSCLVGCGGAPTNVAVQPGPTQPIARPLSLGETRGAFSTQDLVDRQGAYVHLYRIELQSARRVRIHMLSGQVDPTLEVFGPNDQHLSNDDAFPSSTRDAMIDFVPSVSGTYEVLASTATPRSLGAYMLLVEARDPGGIGPAITPERPLTAALGEHTQPLLPGTWLHFDGHAGSIVRLRVTSQAFDTVATLIGPGGQTWVNDDANDLGHDGNERALDSTILAALPQSGIYQLVVTSYGAGAGPFTVRSEVRPPVIWSGNGRPERLAGPDGRGHILGLYAGITAYEQRASLYGCADDARLLAAAMRASHLQNEEDQLVLPDSLATRAAFLSGLAQIAAQARPEDVVVVFFSGHGEQQADRSNDELDNLDESIILADGSFSDDEIARALEPVRAGTIVLAIDACYSGGFADDFVVRRGRMGLFSSDEDVLSDVAVPHRAGGYLAWYLRRGVLGEADARPRDGVLSAGELTDYLNDGFVRDHALINPERQIDRAQRLIVRRGAIGWDQLLWVYPRNRDLSLPALPNLPLTSEPPG